MNKISAKSTFFYKRIFPVFWIILLTGFAAGATYFGKTGGHFSIMYIIAPGAMIITGLLVMKKYFFSLADVVWDDGTALIVKHKGDQIRIRILDMVNAHYDSATIPPRITIRLAKPVRFGSQFAFMPPGKLFSSANNPAVDELIRKIQAGRRTAVN